MIMRALKILFAGKQAENRGTASRHQRPFCPLVQQGLFGGSDIGMPALRYRFQIIFQVAGNIEFVFVSRGIFKFFFRFCQSQIQIIIHLGG